MNAVITLWIVLLPFISFATSFEGPKVIWLWLGGIFLSIYWIVKLLNKTSIYVDSSIVIFGFWIVVLFISSIFGVHPYTSIIGGSYRHQGIIFFMTLGMASLYILQMSKLYKSRLSQLLIFSAAFQSVVIIYQNLFLHISKPIGTIGESNAASGFLALSIYWILTQKQIHTYLRIILLIVNVVSILITNSRSGLFMITFIFAMCTLRYLFMKKTSPLSIGIILGMMISAILFGYVQIRKITIVHPVSSVESRSVMATVGLHEMLKKPLLGYGAESGEIIYDTYFKRISMPLVDFMIDRSHIIFLDVALWSGVFGLFFFCSWIFIRFREIYFKSDILRLIALTSWIFFSCVQPIGVVHWMQLILFMYLV